MKVLKNLAHGKPHLQLAGRTDVFLDDGQPWINTKMTGVSLVTRCIRYACGVYLNGKIFSKE